MDIDRAWASFLTSLEYERKSPRTIEAYELAAVQLQDHLKQFGHSLQVTDITKGDIREFITLVLEDRSPATARQRFGSLRVLFNFLEAESDIEVNPFDGLKAPKVPEKLIPTVGERRFQRLIEECRADDNLFLGRRDEALITLLYGTGLRVSEIAGIAIEPRLVSTGRRGVPAISLGPNRL